MERLKDIDCSREEARRMFKLYGKSHYLFIPAEYGGWFVNDVVQILFMKTVELEERLETLEADRKRYQD